MKKLIIVCFIILLTALFSGQVSADNTISINSLPQEEGSYNIKEKPNLKLKVFIHKPKIEKNSARGGKKPTPTPTKPPVCTVSDPESQALVSFAGWKLASGNTNYVLNTANVPSTVGINNFISFTKDAFSRWSGAILSTVIFSQSGTSIVNSANYDGMNLISWGDPSSSALAITYVWYYPDTGMAVEEDTIINKNYSWSWTPYNLSACVKTTTYDAQDILTHELGHWLGLSDHYDAALYEHATMYGYASTGEIKKDTLTTSDISGASAIYK